MIDFKQYSISEDGFNNYYLIKLYDSSVIHFAFVDYAGEFTIDEGHYNFTDVEFHSLVNVRN